MKENLYIYKAKVVRIVDGDTLIANLDRGFKDYSEKRLRIIGIEAQSLTDKDETLKKSAKESKKFLEELLPVGTEIFVKSLSLDLYGRPLSHIWVDKGNGLINVGDEMISKGHAIKYV